ncbi:MAG: hypothetical protein GC200_01835 [Tepidisphaera sp.]|nr:hypothetical protein [Tepidisphaera sp.]
MADSKRRRGGSSVAVWAGYIVVLAGWAFVLASLIGFHRADPPGHLVWPPNQPVANWCGPLGATVAYSLFKLLGLGAWPLVSLFGLGILWSAAGATVRDGMTRLIGLVLLSCAVAGIQAHLLVGTGPLPDLPGGLVGVVGADQLQQRFGGLGATLVLFGALLIGALVAMDEWVLALMGWGWVFARERGLPAAKVAGVVAGEAALTVGAGAAKAGGGAIGGLWGRLFGPKRRSPRLNDIDDDTPGRKTSGRRGKKAQPALDIADPDQELAGTNIIETKPAKGGRGGKKAAIDEAEIEPELEDELEAGATSAEIDAAEDDNADKSDAIAASDEPDEEDEGPGAPQVYTEDALREKIAKLPVVFGQRNKAVASAEDLALLRSADAEATTTVATTPEAAPPKPYQFPGLDLLENPEENFNAKLEEYVRDQATALESALKQYRIDGEVVGIESGPVITLFDVRLAPGTKVSALSAVSSDIARALKSINIRIVPNQAGRDTVGVEVPNATKEKVRMKELMAKTDRFASMKLPMFLGKDASGEPLIEDLTKMPHMLIAGTTGSGKSVCMNTIIMGFLYTKKPSELKLVLVDPKMVEMSQFKDIPHLMCPVVTEMSKAAAILEWATTKMDERYELLAEAGCRDIASYNDLSWDELKERMNPKTPEEEARIPRKLPYMVFIIDELADLMMTNKEVEGFIIRIAQKARAVGIHLILATQRPQANVVTGLIKSNMPCRIAFKVASGMDSRIVLDQKGGELLLGHGDMLILSPRSSKLSRAQGTLVDDIEIRRVVRFMRDVAGPSFERSLLQIRSAGADGAATGLGSLTDEERLLQSKNNSSASLAAAQEDPLFPRAVEIVLETKRGSVSLLQRRLAIGYTRASRLIDLMGIAGIISDHKGSVARDVLITLEDWTTMKRLAAEEAKAKGLKSIEEASASAGAMPSGESPSGEPGKLFTGGGGNAGTEAPPFDTPEDADGTMPGSLTDEDERFDDAFEEDEDEEEDNRR